MDYDDDIYKEIYNDIWDNEDLDNEDYDILNDPDSHCCSICGKEKETRQIDNDKIMLTKILCCVNIECENYLEG